VLGYIQNAVGHCRSTQFDYLMGGKATWRGWRDMRLGMSERLAPTFSSIMDGGEAGTAHRLITTAGASVRSMLR